MSADDIAALVIGLVCTAMILAVPVYMLLWGNARDAARTREFEAQNPDCHIEWVRK